MSDDGGYLAKILATTRFGKDTRPDSARQIRCGIVGEPVVAGKVEKATKPANALEDVETQAKKPMPGSYTRIFILVCDRVLLPISSFR